MNETAEISLECPAPRMATGKILLGHGSGGKMTSQLIDSVFLPAFGKKSEIPHDGAFLNVCGKQLVFTTDSFVVNPLFFPGGDIGALAVNGTVNDLAMCGATPLYLSCGFILEEGFEIENLQKIVASMKAQAELSGVSLVTGDTKVVEMGKGDGVYVNTSGIGVIEYRQLMPEKIQPGDLILVNGDIGRHGMAVMSAREGLEFAPPIISDTKSLAGEVSALLKGGVEVHALRDLTRGGLATALVEIAEGRKITLEIEEGQVPIEPSVKGACEFLGLDPLYVACEGRMAAFVAPETANLALEILRSFDPRAKVIGRVTDGDCGRALAKTFLGTKRLLDRLLGDQLPRIC